MPTPCHWFALTEAFLLIVFILLLFLVPVGRWKTGEKIEKDSSLDIARKRLRDDEQQVEFTKIATDLKITTETPLEIGVIRDKIYRAIDYAIKRHDWYEEQRFRLFQILLALSTFVVTVIGWQFKAVSDVSSGLEAVNPWADPTIDAPSPARGALCGFLTIILISLFTSLQRYNSELDADRPYRLTADIRIWFFRYQFPKHSDSLVVHQDPIATSKNVLSERRRFFSAVIDNLRPLQSLREDLEQLFILQAIQRYKSESLIRLRWTLIYTILALSAQAIVYVVVSLVS